MPSAWERFAQLTAEALGARWVAVALAATALQFAWAHWDASETSWRACCIFNVKRLLRVDFPFRRPNRLACA